MRATASSDIVEGNLKLILGLMWTLILHYSISMPVWDGDDFDPSLTPKQRLLKWIQSKIPDVPVNNFTTDWNTGKAIGALVDACAPGLCPEWKNWTPEDALKNAAEALQLAEEWLDIPQLIKPKEMCNRKVDELSMMTYLSQFPCAKLKENAPLRAAVGEANPARVRCYGPGLQPSGVCAGAETNFTVETFSAGSKGDVQVSIEDPKGTKVPVSVQYNDDKNMTYTCRYTAPVEGEHKISVKFNDTEVPKSPFVIQVETPAQNDGHKKCFAKGPGIEPKGKVRVGQQTHIDIITQGAGNGQLEVNILDPEGKPNSCPCRLRKMNDDKYKCEYVADSPGLHSISILFAGKPIQKSPFGVNVEPFVDPRKVRATGRGLQSTGLRMGDLAKFKVSVEDKKAGRRGSKQSELQVKLVGPDGKEEPVAVRRIESPDDPKITTFECDFKPTKEGDHRLSISLDGQEVRQFEINVSPPSQSKVVAFGPGLHGGCVGKPNKFRVDTRGERGTLGFTIDGPGEAKIECKDNGDGTADVEWTVAAPGEYALHVLSNGEDIPNSAFCAQIKPRATFDENAFTEWYKTTHPKDFEEFNKERKGSGSGKGADEKVRKIVAGLPSTLTITMADLTGLVAYILAPSGKKTDCELKPHPSEPTKTIVQFTANEPGEHFVHLIKNDKPVGGSPFKIIVAGKPAGNPQNVKIDLEKLKKGKINFENVFYIDCRGAGGGKIGVNMQGPAKPVVTCVPDQEAGVFKVTWSVDEPGKYNLEVRYDGTHIGGSPFEVHVPKLKKKEDKSEEQK